MASPRDNRLLWRKAAVLGSLWAASEIVLGSFLHNARVPFKGLLLTGIGIAVMAAGHRLWPERGLLWRTGLVCAHHGSVSPSAVIFGPMIAIFMEGLLAETALRLLGFNAAGYLLAGGLAMVWPLAHKIGNLLIFYGPDTLAVYARGLQWLRDRAGIGPENIWLPVIVLLCLHFLLGLPWAVLGLRAARPGPLLPPAKERAGGIFKGGGTGGKRWAPAIFIHILLLAAVLSANKALPPAGLAAAAVLYGAICARRYPRAAKLLGRAGVWGGVLGFSLLAGFVLKDPLAGFYMAARAFLVTMGFAALGEELLNPAVRGFLEKKCGTALFETLEYAFASLPRILSSLPAGRDMLRRPAASLRSAVARAPGLLKERDGAPVFFITGKHGCGKSELVLRLAEGLRKAGLRTGGICARGFWAQGVRSGFDIADLSTGREVPLCRRGLETEIKAGEFGFFKEGVAAGLGALSAEALADADAVFIDEAGFLELEGGGWAGPLERLLGEKRVPLVIVVRDYLLAKARQRWGLEQAAAWDAGEAASFGALLTALDPDRPSC